MMKALRLLVVLGISAIGVSGGSRAQGNQIVIMEIEANSASGVVYGGGPDKGNLLKDVRVLQCDAPFRTCLDVAKTDANGRYKLSGKVARLGTVYLEFVLPGFDELRLTVKVRQGSAKLKVILPIGT